eukprot:27594-Eustigmatos_ZCMA.PRE.1
MSPGDVCALSVRTTRVKRGLLGPSGWPGSRRRSNRVCADRVRERSWSRPVCGAVGSSTML